MSLQDTLGNENWLKTNENKVKELFPIELTNIEHLNGLNLGSGLRTLGVQWRTEKEFEMIMVFLQKLGFIIREGQGVKRNPHSIF
jgi:hypothetical protein